MTLNFSKISEQRLQSAHPDLQKIARGVLAFGLMDFVIVEGHRIKEKQDEYFKGGRSEVRWPDGKHNKIPSEAIDIAPWINDMISWNKMHCCVLAGIFLTVAKIADVDIRWGGNWDNDLEPITDQDFQDLVHYELRG